MTLQTMPNNFNKNYSAFYVFLQFLFKYDKNAEKLFLYAFILRSGDRMGAESVP